MRSIVTTALLLILVVGFARADAPRLGPSNAAGLYDESHALLIGVSGYTNGWPKLSGVPEDIRAVEIALKKIGFQTEVVMDPDRQGLDKAIWAFIARHGGKQNNRLLFYYAGHGHTLKASYGGEMGYIVPREAPLPDQDRAGFMASAMSMQMIEIYARQIEAKHVLFVFDSCFSGSVFHPTRAVPETVQEKSLRPVRQFITSGTADQQVPDYSFFRREFIKAITGEAGLGKDGYLTGSQLGMYLEEKVTGYSHRTQTPQYGKLQDPNLDRGDFIFMLPNVTKAQPMLPLNAELIFWRSIADSKNSADFEEYLRKYPNGQFVALAHNKLIPSQTRAVMELGLIGSWAQKCIHNNSCDDPPDPPNPDKPFERLGKALGCMFEDIATVRLNVIVGGTGLPTFSVRGATPRRGLSLDGEIDNVWIKGDHVYLAATSTESSEKELIGAIARLTLVKEGSQFRMIDAETSAATSDKERELIRKERPLFTKCPN